MNTDVKDLLKTAGSTLRVLYADNKRLANELHETREKIAAAEKEARIHKLADMLEERQLWNQLNYREKLAQLRQEPDLDGVEAGMRHGMRPPTQMVAKTAQVSENTHDADSGVRAAYSAWLLEQDEA